MIIPVCRLSIFGDFRMFKPTSSNIVSWMQALQKEGYEMLPNIIQLTGPVVPSQFIEFSEPNKREARQLLRLTNQHIDVECSMIDSASWQETLQNVFSDLLKLLQTGLELDKETKGTRLGYSADVLIQEPDSHSFQPFYCNNNFGLVFGGGEMTVCDDWQHCFNQRMALETDSNKEMCNLILFMEKSSFPMISDDTQKIKKRQGLRISVDLNTKKENDMPRFLFDDMKVFCQSAMKEHLAVLKNIIKLVKL